MSDKTAMSEKKAMSDVTIIQPGMLALLQDAGRFGQHQIGLTTGGPIDPQAFAWANRLLANDANAVQIEASIGGLKLQINTDTQIAVTGADMPLLINGEAKPLWQTLNVRKGDVLTLGYSQQGCRTYIAVRGGFQVTPRFGSAATVVREGIGGLNGAALAAGDDLSVSKSQPLIESCMVPEASRPVYENTINLRVIPGYQEKTFSRTQQRLFFSSEYTVSNSCDRMGYRLAGQNIKSSIEGILSEGICLGAIQIPADGQPIVLMNDRQTIGGYPKIGSVLSLDLARLGQLTPGGKVRFEPITIDCAHNALCMAQSRFNATELIPAPADKEECL